MCEDQGDSVVVARIGIDDESWFIQIFTSRLDVPVRVIHAEHEFSQFSS